MSETEPTPKRDPGNTSTHLERMVTGEGPPSSETTGFASLEAVLKPPEPEQKLWRYMSLGKFVSLLGARALWFSRLDLLGDAFEGSFPQFNVKNRPGVYPEVTPETLDLVSATYRSMRRWLLASCWHASEHESDAMWRLYAPSGEGVAIRTTANDLEKSIFHDEAIFIGSVRYIDYEREWMPEGNAMYSALHKRLSFEHEREVRALIMRPPQGASGYSAEPDFTGQIVPVDLRILVGEVRVAPTAPSWFLEAVGATLRAFDLDHEPQKSVLDEDPRW